MYGKQSSKTEQFIQLKDLNYLELEKVPVSDCDSCLAALEICQTPSLRIQDALRGSLSGVGFRRMSKNIRSHDNIFL